MYAIIDAPGGQHFDYYGPCKKAEAEAWAERRCREIREQHPAHNPRYRLVPDRDAWKMTNADGSRPIPRPAKDGRL